MAKITIPEFKSGELLSVDTFNQMNEEFRSLEIDDENLAIEGIHQRNISTWTVFDEHRQEFINKSKLLEKTYDADDLPSVFPISVTPATSGVGNPIKFASILSTEQVLIRVSCRVRMEDFGARTFGKGKPPWVALMLRSFDGGEADPDTEDRSDWDDIPETLQHFALAFTGRKNGLAQGMGSGDHYGSVPMALYVFPSDNGLPNNTPYEAYDADSHYNALAAFVGVGATESTYDPTVYGPFHYDFSYTFAYLYSPSTDQINKSFQVFGYQQLFEQDTNIEIRNRPEQLGFWVEDFQLTAHKIKR
jgi:hypothetical protein